LVGGRWQVIGAGRDAASATVARFARRSAKGAAPVAVGAAVTGGTILVCRAAGWPNPLSGAAAQQPAPGDTAGFAGATASSDGFAWGEGLGLLMSGPSIFGPGIFGTGSPAQDLAGLTGELHAPGDPAPVAVPEPSSVALFGGFLLLFALVVLGRSARRRQWARTPPRHP
jgi:hypothetical protein